MNGIGLDDFESEEYGESDDYGESGDDTEADYAEDRSERERWLAAQRRRRIRAEVARRQQQQERARLRGRPSVTARRSPTPRQAVTAIRNVELNARVREDALSRAIADHARRADRAALATAASVAFGQLVDSFPGAVRNDFLRAGFRFAPMLLLAPHKHGTGPGALLRDPRVACGVVITGLVVAQHRGFFHRASKATAFVPKVMPAGTNVKVRTLRDDGTGNLVDVPGITWIALTPGIGTIGADGTVTKVAAGDATFSAVIDGEVQTVTVTIA